MPARLNLLDSVIRNQAFDPFSQPDFGPEDYAIWNMIGDAESVSSVMNCGLLPAQRVQKVLLRLLDIGALELRCRDDSAIHIIDQTELGAVNEAEKSLLAENCDLVEWERRRIISMMRLVDSGDYYGALGVPSGSTRSALKRAYYEMAKEYHPDRYYQKSLGAFAPVLSRIFETLADAVKRLATRASLPEQPRQRLSERYAYAVAIRLHCESWPAPEVAVTANVSDGGMFIVTQRDARPGDRIRIEMPVPRAETLQLRGHVVSHRSLARAKKIQRDPGLGVVLQTLSSAQRRRYDDVLAIARLSSPRPTSKVDAAIAEQGVVAEGSRRVKRRTIIGIDFGTTYTAVSANTDNKVHLLRWPDGSWAIPSVVGFPKPGENVVGHEARGLLPRHPRYVVPAAKRLLGRRCDDDTIQQYLSHTGYETSKTDDGWIAVRMWDEEYAVGQLCSYVIQAARVNAEHQLATAIDQAVFTVPVTFDAHKIRLLRRAASLAGLEAVAVIDEPSAAAFANRHQPSFGGVVGVYDFGGGTFDFSVVDASAGDFQVLVTAGDGWLGGDDIDLASANAVADRLERRYGVDVRKRAVEWQQLLTACERTKRELSDAPTAELLVPEILRLEQGMMNLRTRVSREPMEVLWRPAIARSIAICTRALQRRGLQPKDLNAIYLSGGTSYIPAVRRAVATGFGVPVRVGVPPEYAACIGAGLHAAEVQQMRMPTLSSFD